MKILGEAWCYLGLVSTCAVIAACGNVRFDGESTQSIGADAKGAEQSASAAATIPAAATADGSVDACAGYYGFTALLAEETIKCTGTIGPRSFVIDDQGLLKHNFTSCTSGVESERAANFENVTKIVGLQNVRSALPRFQECLTDRFTRWRELFARTKLQTCPVWSMAAVFGKADKVRNRQFAKMRPQLDYVPAGDTRSSKRMPDQRFVNIKMPDKTSILYDISYPQEEKECLDPAACAAQCAAFLPGFVVSAGGTQVLADPASWFEPGSYAPNTCKDPANSPDPWCPPDFVHPMSVNNTSGGPIPPGDIFGHENRVGPGERCMRWVPTAGGGGHDYITDFTSSCTNSHCVALCGN